MFLDTRKNRRLRFIKLENTREIALCFLYRSLFEDKQSFDLSKAISALLSQKSKEEIKQALAMYYGVQEHYFSLFYFMEKLSRKKVDDLSPLLVSSILLTLWQLRFSRFPQASIVDEMCKLVKKYGHQGEVNYLHALARNFLRQEPNIPDKRLDLKYNLSRELLGCFKKDYGLEKTLAILEAFQSHGKTLEVVLRVDPDIACFQQEGLFFEPLYDHDFILDIKNLEKEQVKSLSSRDTLLPLSKDEVDCEKSKKSVHYISEQKYKEQELLKIAQKIALSKLPYAYKLYLQEEQLLNLPSFQKGLFWMQGFAAQLTAELAFRLIMKIQREQVQRQQKDSLDKSLAITSPKVMNIYDLCAAPGGKTLYLHERLASFSSFCRNEEMKEGQAKLCQKYQLIASDLSYTRLQSMEENLQRLQIPYQVLSTTEEQKIVFLESKEQKGDYKAVRPTRIQKVEGKSNEGKNTQLELALFTRDAQEKLGGEDLAFASSVDVLLCDVPCSCLGLLGKKPDLAYNMKYETIQKLLVIQKDILQKNAALIKKGGYLLYSTCTLTKAENEEQVQTFLASEAGQAFVQEDISDFFKKEYEEECKGESEAFSFTRKDWLLLPDELPCEGFYLALLRKK